MNLPLAESSCTGYAIGLAVNGHRPIEEYQFADFSTEAVTQIALNAATMHFRSGARVPLVLRFPCGGGLTFGSFHSEELESLFLSMPGLKALYPSNPQDAFNALLAAFEDDNPVLLFEHKGLYRRGKYPVAWDPDYRDVWNPHNVRSGDYATLVTYGEMVHLAGEVCDYFTSEYERTFDLWDLRALSPLRLDAIKASLARTHRLIVLHEGRRTHGFGAELVASLTEELFFSLEAPPLRLCALDLPVPFAPELDGMNGMWISDWRLRNDSCLLGPLEIKTSTAAQVAYRSPVSGVRCPSRVLGARPAVRHGRRWHPDRRHGNRPFGRHGGEDVFRPRRDGPCALPRGRHCPGVDFRPRLWRNGDPGRRAQDRARHSGPDGQTRSLAGAGGPSGSSGC
jgi:pyruvate/2-oxoglutarate/acetoin dehydrogenase E1 component